jgi:prepilin-type N-terminal cleavage/methylation domain-containing protein
MNKGFSLIELIMVITIISVVMCFSIEQIQPLKEGLAVRTFSQQLLGDLNYIKQRSVQRGTVYELNCAKNFYTISYFDNNTGYFVKDRIESLKSGIIVENPVDFRFSNSGFPIPGYFGTAQIKSLTGKTAKIVVSSVGRIRIE